MSSSRTVLFAVAVLVSLVADGLGLWQFNRLLVRRRWNDAAMGQRDLAPVDLTTTPLPAASEYRRVRVVGRYDFEREIALRGRVYRGAPGVQIVTPLRLAAHDTAILVNRGFVPTPDAGLLASSQGYREPDSVGFEGVALTVPDAGDGGPLATEGGTTWHRLDLTALRAVLPYPVAPYYLIVAVDSSVSREHTLRGHTLPVRIDPPALDDGPHLSYAIQWFMIGIAALTFGLVFIRRGAPRSTLAA
jgi:surfeit locus 1 family protein